MGYPLPRKTKANRQKRKYVAEGLKMLRTKIGKKAAYKDHTSVNARLQHK